MQTFANNPVNNSADESVIQRLADRLNLPRPEVWESAYDGLDSLLHELGHWAVTPQWAIDWWKAMRPVHHRKSVAPPIPYLFHPGQVLPDDLAVVQWTAEVKKAMGWSWPALPSILLTDRPAGISCESGLSRSCADLRRFGISPLEGQFVPIDDGFRLPHPSGTSKTEIVENWRAIAAFYPDRCASDFQVLSPELESTLDRQLALGRTLQAI